MFTTKKNQLNKFTDVVVPKRKDLFARIGYRQSQPYATTTRDEFDDPVNLVDSASKMEVLKKGLAREAYEENQRQIAHENQLKGLEEKQEKND